MSAVVLLPEPSAMGIEARSKIERQALFHIVGTGLWARNGSVVRVPPTLGALLLVLASARGHTLAYGAIIDALYGDDPEGGPLDPIGSLKVLRTRHADDLASLGVEIAMWWGCGWRLEVRRLVVRGKKSRAALMPAGSEPFWAHRARFMFERGATTSAIAEVLGRNPRNVTSILRGGYSPRVGGARKPSDKDVRRRSRLRHQARLHAIETGEPVEQIYARWGCEAVDRSKLWDQRRAAQPSLEARS